jgi:hypothetical protein
MQSPRELTPEEQLERDRQAWNLPRPLERPQSSQAPFSVRSGREDKTESELEAA